MPRKPNPRTLAAAFLSISAALSVALLAVRNLYDDEIFSLDLITRPVAYILSVAAEGDVHPPGMFLLAHMAWRIVPSFRWMNLVPGLALYGGLAVFLLRVTPLFVRARARVCLLLLATLHPQLLMWSATYRWYGWWTGLALIALTVALQPREARPVLRVVRGLVVGLLLACLFYLNYITLLFGVALAAAMLLRYRAQPRRELVHRALLIAGVFLALIAPQLHTMIAVHLPAGQDQRSGVAVSSLRLLLSVASSEAYLPWHPIAILADLLFAGLCVWGANAWLRLRRDSSASAARPSGGVEFYGGLASITLFAALFFLLVAGTGLGGKPRNGLLLVPVLAPVGALIVERLRRRAQDAILIFLALWSGVGIAHLLGRYGLTKATMDDRPEQVVAFVGQTSGQGCAVVVTYDSALAFSLAQAKLPRTLTVSLFRGQVFGGSRALPAEDCARPYLYVVQSYLGGTATQVATLDAELDSTIQYIYGPPRIDRFSFDSDAARKRSLSRIGGLGDDLVSAARLPDYRYVVVWGTMESGEYEAMRRRMPHFKSGYAVSVDDEPSAKK